MEDTVCYLVPAESFKKVLDTNQRFSGFFTTLIRRQFRSFRTLATDGKISEESALVLRIDSVLYKEPVVCRPDVSVREAVAKMDRHGVSSIVVVDDGMRPAGILTHKDLRRAVARGGTLGNITHFMSSPVKTVPAGTKILDGLIEMIESRIDHLVVTEHERVIGVVTRKDIQTQMEPSSSIISYFRRIVKAVSVPELQAIFGSLRTTVAKVAMTGVGFHDLSRIISSAYDALTVKVIDIVREEHPAAGRFTWLHTGSSGRKEQIIATDQDSALIRETSGLGETSGLSETSGLLALAGEVTEVLAGIGIPKCPGSYMASNPSWNQDLSAWRDCFSRWFDDPVPDHVRYLSIFLDMRVIWGDEEPHGRLLDFVRSHITRKAIELLAYDAVELEPPLGIFGIIGLHKGVDLKTYGIYPIVNGVRVLALDRGIVEAVNTKERLQALRQAGEIGGDLCNDLIESHGFIQDLRLKHHAAAVLSRSEVNNLIRGKEIGKVDLLLLKESLKIVSSFQKFLMKKFGVRRVGAM
jgi:CBS domain-containing protein